MNFFRRKAAPVESVPVPTADTDARMETPLGIADADDPFAGMDMLRELTDSEKKILPDMSELEPEMVAAPTGETGLEPRGDFVPAPQEHTQLPARAATPDPTVARTPAGHSSAPPLVQAELTQETGPFVARARMAGQLESAPARRRIWDIEDGAPLARPAPADVGAPEPVQAAPCASPLSETGPAPLPEPQAEEISEDVALARAQIARFSQAGLEPEAKTTGTESPGSPRPPRAKTRLLGFQSAAFAERDPFAGTQVNRAGNTGTEPCFPVGWIVVIDGPGRGASFTLTSGVSSIGRGEDQAIRLDYGDGSISRHSHACIAFDEEVNRFFLGHGGKSNIVRLNGRPVLSTEDLTGGDTIRIGETSLQFVAFCGEEFVWDGKDEQPEDADVAAE